MSQRGLRLWIDEKARELGYVVVFFIFGDRSDLCGACERRRERLVVVVGGDGIGTMMMMMTRLILFLGVNDGVVL